MTDAELINALKNGTIKSQVRGTCPICGDYFEVNHYHGRMSCPKKECYTAIRRCSMIASKYAQFSTSRAKVDAARAGNICAGMIDPWLANYGSVWVNADPVLGF